MRHPARDLKFVARVADRVNRNVIFGWAEDFSEIHETVCGQGLLNGRGEDYVKSFQLLQ
jgi:hypothetical protein